MTEEQTTPTPAPKRGVRTSTQIIIWVVLMALLVLVGLGLKKSAKPDHQRRLGSPRFPLGNVRGIFLSGWVGSSFSRLARQSGGNQFLGFLVQTL